MTDKDPCGSLIRRVGITSKFRRLISTLLALILAGCNNPMPPAAETGTMVAELNAQRARINLTAHLSARAYLTEGETRTCPRILSRRPRVECFAVPVPNAANAYQGVYLIETDDKTHEQTIAIRGTINLADSLTDLGTQRIRDPRLNVVVHSGFQTLAEAIHGDILNNRRLKPSYRIFVTGHSLGGAAALLLGLYLYVDQGERHQIGGVYTFGQPKVFDNQGTTSWPIFSRHVFRIVNCDDPVPILPTSEAKLSSLVRISLFDSDRRNDYQHMGQSILLMDNGQFWMPGSIELERDLASSLTNTMAGLWNGKPVDHSIAEYISRLDALSSAGGRAAPVNPSARFPCSRPASSDSTGERSRS